MGFSALLIRIRKHVGSWLKASDDGASRQSHADAAGTASARTPSTNDESGSRTRGSVSESRNSTGERVSSSRATGDAGETTDYPEAQIYALLTSQDGIVRQADIVSRTDWSKSTISRCLSKLEEHGHVKRIPMEQSKLVLLPSRELADYTKLSHDSQ